MQPLNGVTAVTGLGAYIALAYRYAIGISGIVATVMFIYGGFRYLIGTVPENVSRGKEIMLDSVIGMILVLGAYLILQTVNPATLNLTVLNPQTIKNVAYQPGAVSSCVQRRVVTDSPACNNDAQCASVRGVCMRTNYFDVNSNTNGGLYDGPADRSSAGGGQCSLGVEGQRCRCAGFGCRLTTGYTSSGDQYSRDMTNFGGIPDEVVPESFTQLQADARLTNNSGQGYINCLSGLSCVFLYNTASAQNSTASNGWYCARVPTRSGGRPGSAAPQNCVRNQDCNGGAPSGANVCIRTDREAGVNSGECAPRTNAPLGARCGCSQYGCLGTLPYNLNGTSLTTDFVDCTQGLVCALYNYSSGGGTAPPNGDWYCSTAVPEDAQTQSAQCQPNGAAATAPGAGSTPTTPPAGTTPPPSGSGGTP